MYTGTFELYDDQTDSLRVFTGECEPYDQGGMAGTPNHDYVMELVGRIQELDEMGNVIGMLDFHDPIHDTVMKGVEANALEQYENAEPNF